MAEKFIDLHTHSVASDGTLSPGELVRQAAERGISALALTDHDTVAGITAARAAAAVHGVEVIAGCEVAVQDPYGEVHLLGLWVPEASLELQNFLQFEQEARVIRNEEMCTRLRAMGVKISLDDLATKMPGGVIGRPHMARFLISEGYAPTLEATFERFLGIKGAAYVPRKLRTAEEAAHSLSSLGATVSIAHPCLRQNMTPKRFEKLIQKLLPFGLSCIEAYHSQHDKAAVSLCLKFAEKYGLLVSGGSDFHGPNKTSALLGYVKGEARVKYTLLEALKESRVNNGLLV